MGVIYQNGEGVARDQKKAFELYQKAAESRIVEAHVRLGDLYFNGHGTEIDDRLALERYTYAAERGDAEAQCKAANLHFHGRGVPAPDVQRAREWYEMSAARRNAEAIKKLAELCAGEGAFARAFELLE